MNVRTFISAGAILACLAISRPSFAEGHTNGPPSVRIVTPQEDAALLAGHVIHICAVSLNFTDRVESVEFFAGTSSLGTVTNGSGLWLGQASLWFPEQFTCFAWSNAAPGAYSLTAQATDLAGLTVTSPPVSITVTTNLPPLVRIVKPHNGEFILGPTNIEICASAFDPDGTVASVTFYQGSTEIGVVTSAPPMYVTNLHGVFPIRQTSYCLTWSNVAPANYSLTAVAVDNGGASTTSEAVEISVVTNLPPVVQIVHPENGPRFFAPATINLCAAARDPDGSVTEVQFFNGIQSVGVVTSGTTVTNQCGVQTLYCLTLSNQPPARYTLTAVATDNGGVSSTSAPVHITVATPPPPLVRIIYPENGAKFVAPATIPIAAVTRYFTNHVASVQFFAGTNLLGVLTNSWWTFVWKNVGTGSYNLSAVATDTSNLSVTSAPVSITVVSNSFSGTFPAWNLR
jgi:hypothetical protein